MKAHLYFIESLIPKEFKRNPDFNNHHLQNAYDLKDSILNDDSHKIVVCRLPFLEIRHYELYQYLQKTFKNLKTFFIVDELSSNMKIKLRNTNDFIVLWKTEEQNLMSDIYKYLDGVNPLLREEKRLPQLSSAMLSPSLFMNENDMTFKRISGGSFENISMNGSCIKITPSNFNEKDFINLTYQNSQGEYVSLEAQVRWTEMNSTDQVQTLGVQFLTKP